MRLADLLGRKDFRRAAQRALEAAGDTIRQAPLAQGQSVLAVMRYIAAVRQWVLAEEEPTAETTAVLQTLHQAYLPGHVLACRLAGSKLSRSVNLDHLFIDRPAASSPWSLYYCKNCTCQPPANTLSAAKALIAEAAEN